MVTEPTEKLSLAFQNMSASLMGKVKLGFYRHNVALYGAAICFKAVGDRTISVALMNQAARALPEAALELSRMAPTSLVPGFWKKRAVHAVGHHALDGDTACFLELDKYALKGNGIALRYFARHAQNNAPSP